MTVNALYVGTSTDWTSTTFTVAVIARYQKKTGSGAIYVNATTQEPFTACMAILTTGWIKN